ncbi:MAG: hypothetical protein JJ900_09900 [Rhodospirillales bacterium]|nr:hypothetical protein [Rhodospirillales bacterium]MBO6787152.1 hypothetical protein [Rhodospirillales bacterium]
MTAPDYMAGGLTDPSHIPNLNINKIRYLNIWNRGMFPHAGNRAGQDRRLLPTPPKGIQTMKPNKPSTQAKPAAKPAGAAQQTGKSSTSTIKKK